VYPRYLDPNGGVDIEIYWNGQQAPWIADQIVDVIQWPEIRGYYFQYIVVSPQDGVPDFPNPE
jgi:hypothetical protein